MTRLILLVILFAALAFAVAGAVAVVRSLAAPPATSPPATREDPMPKAVQAIATVLLLLLLLGLAAGWLGAS